MTRPLRLVVATAVVEPGDVEWLAAELGAAATLTHLPVPWRDASSPVAPLPGDWAVALCDADVVLGFVQQLPDVLRPGTRAALVQHAGAGVDARAVDAFRRAGVGLVTAAGVGARSVGDFAVAALLALALRHPERARAQHERRWQRFPTAELRERRALVVGAGPVGSRVCAILAALGCAVTAARRRPHLGAPAGARAVVGLDALPEALETTDALVLAIALSPRTAGLVGAEELARMPQGALVVNVGRGALLDEDALVAALRAGRLGGVWLDVFDREPLPRDSPLWAVPGLCVSAHDATATAGYSRRLADRARQTVVAWSSGAPIPHMVVEPTRSAAAA